METASIRASDFHRDGIRKAEIGDCDEPLSCSHFLARMYKRLQLRTEILRCYAWLL